MPLRPAPAYCIRLRAASTISTFADLPRPSSETTVTMTGKVIPGPTLQRQTSLMSEPMRRETGTIGAADRKHVEGRIDAAAVDEVADERGETF